MALATRHGAGARCPSPSARLDGTCGHCLAPALAVLSPALCQCLPVPRSLWDGRVSWHRRWAGDVPVPGGTGQAGVRILLLLSSGILWNVQGQSCLSFVLQKEKQPLARHKGRDGGDERRA